MDIKQKSQLDANASVSMSAGGIVPLRLKNTWTFECLDSNGNVKWTEEVENITVNTGLDDILDKYWKGSNYTAAHYVGLTDGTPTVAAGDTIAAGGHAGWVEVTAYSDPARPTLTLDAVSGQSVSNSTNKASFSINASATVGGAFIVTDSTRGGTAGTLIAVAAFGSPGDRAVASGDTINVTVTLTASG